MFQIRMIASAVTMAVLVHGEATAQNQAPKPYDVAEKGQENDRSPWVLPTYRQEPTARQPVERSGGATHRNVNVFDLSRHDATFQSRSANRRAARPASNLLRTGGYARNAPGKQRRAEPTSAVYGNQCDGGCTPSCGPDCHAFWEHRSGLFGEFLYLTARDANLSYTVPVDGTGVNAVPIGRVGVADPDYEPGFRVGGSWMLDACTSLTANVTHYESSNFDRTELPGGTGFLRAELVHPNTTNVASDSLSADASYDIDFDLVDVNYKGLVWGGCDYSLNYLLGFRYGNLEQDLRANYLITGSTTVDAEVDFDGFGPRVGLDGERLIGRGFLVYGKGFANFLAGDFDAQYRQSNIFSGTQAATGIEDDRIVSLLELEIGLGWQSKSGRVRATAGYYVGSWFNTLTMPEFINGVQADNLDDVDDTLTFDGLTTRVEFRY